MTMIKQLRMWLINRKYNEFIREAKDKDDKNWAAMWLGCRTREILGNGKEVNVNMIKVPSKQKSRKTLKSCFLMAEICDECKKIIVNPFETTNNLDEGSFHDKCFEKRERRLRKRL